MALVLCPLCHKRISNKATQCPHCKASVNDADGSALRIGHLKKGQRLMNQSFLAMSLFIAGVVVMFWGGEEPQGNRLYAGAVMLTLGFVGYLISRLQLILHKRKST